MPMHPTAEPLGYIDLPTGPKAIFPMNDIFLNYTFEKTAYWETLRTIVNTIIGAYRVYTPETRLMPIEGIIEVLTQYKQFINAKDQPKSQDIKITETTGDATFIEFQNHPDTNPPIPIRAVEYFGLGIGHNKGKPANQIWLLADDVPTITQGATFARYILKNEVTGERYSADSGILFVNLPKLADDISAAGELASLLLGKTKEPIYELAKNVMQSLNAGFAQFKSDKGVPDVLSVYERGWNEGMYEGKIEGRVEGRVEGMLEGKLQNMQKIMDFIKSGMTINEVLRKLEEELGETGG